MHAWSAAALWVGSLELAGAALFAAAAVLDVCLRRRSAATRRAIWALCVAVALALPLTRLVLPAPTLGLSPRLAAPLLAIWATGAALLLARLVRGQALARRRRARSLPLDDGPWQDALLQETAGRPRVELRLSPGLASPHVTGVVRPAILVPPHVLAAPASERRALLAHELAHVARADCLLLLAGSVARAIYWISPLPWWALRRLRACAEEAADDAVLDTGISSSRYAAALVAVARAQLGRAGRVAADGLRERVGALLDARRVRSREPARRSPWSVPRVVAAALLLATMVTACEARSADVPRAAEAGAQYTAVPETT